MRTGGNANPECARRMSACVTELLRKQPFFGSLALRLPLRADDSRETLASDGREIRYSPGWVADTGAQAIQTAMARVVMACALKHHTRRDGRDPERWQRASQNVTHHLLRDAGFELPDDVVAWEGMSVEEAYGRLGEEEREDPPGNDNESPGNGESGCPAGGGAGTFPDPSDDSLEEGEGEDSGSSAQSPNGYDEGDSDEPEPGTGGDGAEQGESDQPDNGINNGGDLEQDSDSGETGTDGGGAGDNNAARNGGGAPSHDPAGTGEVLDSPCGAGGDSRTGDTPRDTRAEERAWDEAMHQAARLARAEGNLPGAVAETVESAHTRLVDWRTLLRRFLVDAAKSDYSWSLPNRRFIDSGLYLPSIHSEGLDTLAVIIDTSGSLPTETLAEFWAELRALASELRPERVIVLQVDAMVQDAAEYSAFDLPESVEIHGRGGTDFRPGFEWLEEQGIQPGLCLYFTDMCCTRHPGQEPGFSTVWLNWDEPPPNYFREPWGERIDMGV